MCECPFNASNGGSTSYAEARLLAECLRSSAAQGAHLALAQRDTNVFAVLSSKAQLAAQRLNAARNIHTRGQEDKDRGVRPSILQQDRPNAE